MTDQPRPVPLKHAGRLPREDIFGIADMRFSNDGRYLFCVGHSPRIELWSVFKGDEEEGLLLKHFECRARVLRSVTVRSDSARFACAADRSVLLFDVARGVMVRKMGTPTYAQRQQNPNFKYTGHEGQVNCVAFGGIDEKNALLASAGADGRALFWDTRNAERPVQVVGQDNRGALTEVRFVGRSAFATASADGFVRVYDLRKTTETLHEFTDAVQALSFSQNAQLMLTSVQGAGACLCDVAPHRNEQLRLFPLARVTQCAFFNEENHIVCGSTSGELLCFDALHRYDQLHKRRVSSSSPQAHAESFSVAASPVTTLAVHPQ
ncbi:MAG: hypothetical protein MHM6MM_008035, partial [Cercozoa sp. M6MM]